MKNNYIFRKATLKGLDKFFNFFSKSIKKQFPEYSAKTRDFFIKQEYNPGFIREQLKNKRLSIYLCFFNQQVVGHLMTMPLVGGVCLANWIAVSENHQKKGIAAKLLKMWEKDAKAKGMHKLHLWTDTRNLNFYKRRGFKLVGKIPKNYYGADDYLFYKSIQKPLEKNYLKRHS